MAPHVRPIYFTTINLIYTCDIFSAFTIFIDVCHIYFLCLPCVCLPYIFFGICRIFDQNTYTI